MKKNNFFSIYKKIAKIAVSAGFKNPSVPHTIGFSLFRKKSVWKLNFTKCPCDEHFVSYLMDHKIENKNIFHFGTGEHHYVGLQNFNLNLKNYIIGITPAFKEFQSYFKLSLELPLLASTYKVICADIYTLNKNDISFFDIATFFHLCEFSIKENIPSHLLDDESLVELFLNRLNTNGLLAFYTQSAGWPSAQLIIDKLLTSQKIAYVEEFKTLKIYKDRKSVV